MSTTRAQITEPLPYYVNKIYLHDEEGFFIYTHRIEIENVV